MNAIFEDLLVAIVYFSFGACIGGFVIILFALIVYLIKNLMKFK